MQIFVKGNRNDVSSMENINFFYQIPENDQVEIHVVVVSLNSSLTSINIFSIYVPN